MRTRPTTLRRFSSPIVAITGCLWATSVHAAPPTQELQQRLIHAVLQDQISTVQHLLKQGGDPNARVAPAKADAWALEHIGDDDPAPPLIVLACRFGSTVGPNVIQLLLDKRADVNLSDRNGVTPLMVASQLGAASVNLLLDHGAKVNVRDRNGRTPLMYALNNRGLNTVALLLDKGANINARDGGGSTPLMLAIGQARDDSVRIYGEDLVKKAAEEGERYRELIAFLLEKRPDVNLRDKAGNTALKLAILQRQPEIVRLVRQAGAKE